MNQNFSSWMETFRSSDGKLFGGVQFSNHLFPFLESEFDSGMFAQVFARLVVGDISDECIRLGRLTALAKLDGGVTGLGRTI